ncbi:PucR family transcriptional regulator ligand-binding domain-containing protein [Peptococcaceae bacterium]|nr:PucR family transcriptional regulator ligand-binding domain-containing protein [Peptococcaceae bacterium]
MIVKCKDILTLPVFKKMKVAAGAAGLHRPVRWVHMAEVIDDVRGIVDWVHGGELLFITGIGLKGNFQTLAELIEKISAKNLAGLVIFIGPYISEIPVEIKVLADKLKFPVFELPWEVPLVDATHSICNYIIKQEKEQKLVNNLVENILFHDFDSPGALIEHAATYGYDLTKNYMIAIIDLDNFAFFLKQHNIKNETKIIAIKTRFQETIQQVLCKYFNKILFMSASDSVIVLIPLEGLDKEAIRKILAETGEDIKQNLKGLTASIGVGSEYSKITDLKQSFKEAEQVLKALKCTRSFDSTSFYEDLGVYMLLLEIKDFGILKKFYFRMLGNLISHDRINKSTLVKTLELFLSENSSAIKTAERLFIHRNTLSYRLKKIEKICNCNLESAQDCFDLRMAFYIKNILSENFL